MALAHEHEHEHEQLAHPAPSSPAGRRQVVVDVFIDLVLERGSATPEEVADRAGVSRATFFRYFASLVELRNEATDRVVERFPDLFALPAVPTGSLDERIRRFIDARVQLHETIHPLELLIRSYAAQDPDTAGFVDAVRKLQADQIRQYFEVDLQPHGPARRDDLVVAICVLTSVESWQQFRQTFGRSPVQTGRAWRRSLAGFLADGTRSTSDNQGARQAR